MAELVVLEEQQHATQHIHAQNLLEHIVKDAIQVIKGLTVVAMVPVVFIQRKQLAQLERVELVFY